MSFWVFSSSSIENIKIAKDRLLWGFWDREAGEKERKNWRAFIRVYNKIKPFDIVIFQIAKTGEIHALGIVKETYYDDQTPVWPKELKKNQVIFPWRVSFCSIIYSDKPFTSFNVRIENYIDGYGIGELVEHEFRSVLTDIQNQFKEKLLEINLG
jgi:hypothetical protein